MAEIIWISAPIKISEWHGFRIIMMHDAIWRWLRCSVLGALRDSRAEENRLTQITDSIVMFVLSDAGELLHFQNKYLSINSLERNAREKHSDFLCKEWWMRSSTLTIQDPILIRFSLNDTTNRAKMKTKNELCTSGWVVFVTVDAYNCNKLFTGCCLLTCLSCYCGGRTQANANRIVSAFSCTLPLLSRLYANTWNTFYPNKMATRLKHKTKFAFVFITMTLGVFSANAKV